MLIDVFVFHIWVLKVHLIIVSPLCITTKYYHIYLAPNSIIVMVHPGTFSYLDYGRCNNSLWHRPQVLVALKSNGNGQRENNAYTKNILKMTNGANVLTAGQQTVHPYCRYDEQYCVVYIGTRAYFLSSFWPGKGFMTSIITLSFWEQECEQEVL